MIKSLSAGSHIQITNGSVSDPYIPSTSQPMIGMVRYVNNNFEVYDGNMWHRLNYAFPSINLTESAVRAIDWAIKEMNLNSEIEQLSIQNPAIKAAHENFLRAKDQLKTTIILSQDEQTTS